MFANKGRESRYVDYPKAITHISLCTGYGGIDLGLKRAIPNLRTVAYSEIDAFACANLVSKIEHGFLDAAPIWTDVRTFPFHEFYGRVDVLSGGYPCQPFSDAGQNPKGKEDTRYLWPAIANGIRSLQPNLCFFENVEGYVAKGLRDAIEDLDKLGYSTTWGMFTAAEIGAPHERKRVFILACKEIEYLADYLCNRLQILHRPSSTRKAKAQLTQSHSNAHKWPSGPHEEQFAWEPPRTVLRRKDNDSQSSMGRVLDGHTDRLDNAELFASYDSIDDEIIAVGNGVVPQVATKAFRFLLADLLG